ncbi:pantoate--beta-alanine ligase [Bradyrhizobium sp. SBR1B]|uniref:pantoate--beta-alanine ligase n=1 Tax=Bradyrhizobium sp. SBR1B TaxID=2663836 RepID=UPI001605F85D|nr:pantoate--beta-alanine ligase [Bradyrhizobium sp. SBR1B]MBB4383453.1 pantoate--beta-alanine ligase [Bradyrhizobium sp. SBR1B]
MHLACLSAGKTFIREVARTGQTIGTVHTFGALHRGQAELIRRAAVENDVAIVTVHPNKIQLRSGGSCDFNLDEDIGLALRSGATAVISSNDTEMFPPGYRTVIAQGDGHLRLGGPDTCLDEAVTGAIRWICYARPTRSYFGLKDIGRAILVKRAVADLLLDCEIRFVPTVRYKNGVPISSCLRRFNPSELDELSCLFTTLNDVRKEIARGVSSVKDLVASTTPQTKFRLFKLDFVRILDADSFEDLAQAKLPLIIFGAATAHGLKIFDSIYVPDQDTLVKGPSDIWIDLPERCWPDDCTL